MNNKIRVCWRSKITNYYGHGEWFENTSKYRSILDGWVEEMNNKYPNIEHWIEK